MDEKDLKNYNFDNLNNVCRYCLNYNEHLMTILDESNNEYTNIFENSSIIQMTENLLNDKINISYQLVRLICFVCYEKLITSYNFKKQCLKSFNLLNKLHNTQIKEECQKEDYIDQLAKKSYECDLYGINNIKENLEFDDYFSEEQLYDSNENDDSIIPKVQIERFDIIHKKSRVYEKENKVINKLIIKNEVGQPTLEESIGRLCSICGTLQKNLNSHISSMHSIDGPYECDICGKIIKMKKYLKYHFDIHLNIRRYKCGICSTSFVGNSSLRVHMLNHTNERKFKCKICEKKFAQSCQLGIHMKRHNRQLAFSCDFCDLRFVDRRGKFKHEILHKNEFPFKCEFCLQAFQSTGNLSRHRLTHTKINPYKCNLCDKTFIRRLDFNTHKRHHEYKII